MAPKRKSDLTDSRQEYFLGLSSFPVVSLDRHYIKDDVARISWSYPTQSSIQQLLQRAPELCEQLGLVQAFSIPYSEPMTHAVKEFAKGFNPITKDCDFRGKKVAFTTDVLRKAFSLPSGKFTSYKDDCWCKAELRKSPRVNVYYPVLTLFLELLMGNQCLEKMEEMTANDFSSWLISIEELFNRHGPVALVFACLNRQIVKLKEYLDRSKDKKEHPRMREITCGTAVTHLLLHLGFTREELSDPTSLTRNMFETDKIDSPVGIRTTSHSVKRVCKQVDTAGPSAARLGKEEKRDNKKQRFVGWEPIAGGEVENSGATGSMLDLQVDDEGQVAATGMDKSVPAASVDLWQTLEENLRIQLLAARIHVQAGMTERDSTIETMRLEKINIESRLRIVENDLVASLEEKREISQTLQKELDEAYKEVVALKKEKSQLESAYETSQDHLEVEKDRSLCRICMDARQDTISLPCLHMQYCFTCLDEHRKSNNTCPTCRLPICGVLQGIGL